MLVVAPVVFDLDAMMSGGEVLAWKPELGTRMALVPRNGGEVRWIETDPFFVWHYGNAYDDGDDVVSTSPGGARSPSVRNRTGPGLHPVRALSGLGKAALTQLDHDMSEFARIDDRLCGQPHRYVTVSQKSGTHDGMLSGEFDTLVRHDMQTGGRSSGRATRARRGRARRRQGAPMGGGTPSSTAGTSPTPPTSPHRSPTSWSGTPRRSRRTRWRRSRMPHRVPNGLHGNWMPADG